jgi:hypothetical protein
VSKVFNFSIYSAKTSEEKDYLKKKNISSHKWQAKSLRTALLKRHERQTVFLWCGL